jgi:hypothetical protein
MNMKLREDEVGDLGHVACRTIRMTHEITSKSSETIEWE